MQAYVENKVEGLEDQLRKMKTQVDDLTRTNGELVNTRNRVTTENSELQRQIRDLENNYGAFSKNKGQLQTQLDDTKSKLEEEMRVNLYLVSLCLLGPFSPRSWLGHKVCLTATDANTPMFIENVMSYRF